ncbi:putative imidazolonepropionase, partial [Rhizoclosmatium hyalinum]
TRAASHETLEALLTTRLNRMLRQGTTLLEAKSGYGLETATELKMLQVLKKAQDSHKIDISATFLGAHSVPKGSTPEEATKDVLENDDGISAMAAQNVFGVLLPTTAYVLRITPPPARKMIDNGVLVALGSDFNPNAHCLSMPFVMNLAAVTMRMTLAEALVAATLNAAASVNKSDLHGSIEVGKWGNFVIVDDPQWTHVVYEMVDSPVGGVYVKGEKIV